jgi:antirestriction protein
MRFYAACLASYNAGVLHGAWIEASDDVAEMQLEVNAMLRASRFPNVTVKHPVTGESVPSAEEWAIHDSEDLGKVSEYAGLEAIAERVKLAAVADDIGIPLSVVLEVKDDNVSNDVESFIRDNYRGQYDSWSDFAEKFTDETDGLSGVPDHLKAYIDFERMGSDWRISGDFHYVERDGSLFVFWSH